MSIKLTQAQLDALQALQNGATHLPDSLPRRARVQLLGHDLVISVYRPGEAKIHQITQAGRDALAGTGPELAKTLRALVGESPVKEAPAKPLHSLIVIGWIGVKRAYLDLSRVEAIRRYLLEQGVALPETGLPGPEELDILAGFDEAKMVKEFTFTDEFSVYDAWN